MHASRSAASALSTFRWAAAFLLVWHSVMVVTRRRDGLMNSGPALAAILCFDVPSVICSLLGKAGYVAVATEIVFNEVLHFITLGLLIPLYLAIYQPMSPVALTRWVLISLAISTTLRAYLCHMKVLFKLSTTSLIPHLVTLCPFYCAVLYRLAAHEDIPSDTRITLQLSLVIHGFNVALHHLKVVGMEELVVELLATLADRAVLLRSAFDATCHVRVLPPREGAAAEGTRKALAGTLQVTSSSPGMDKLCCCSMTSEILTAQRVTSGLPNLTEIVMCALDLKSDPVLNRTILTLRNSKGFELDCEVRAVSSGNNTDGLVMCGLRQIGEKREVFQEEGNEPIELPVSSPVQTVWEDCASRPSLGERVMSGLSHVWTSLRADPEPEQLPTTLSVLRALRCVDRLLWVQCNLASLEMVKASVAAKQEFQAPVLGRTVPTLLVSGSAAQKLRQALVACRELRREDLLARGCHYQRFGEVALRLSGGPSLPVAMHLLVMPSSSPASLPDALLIFDKLPRSSLRTVTLHSVKSSDVAPDDSASQVGLQRRRGCRTTSWGDEKSIYGPEGLQTTATRVF